MSITKYGAVKEETSKTASGAPGTWSPEEQARREEAARRARQQESEAAAKRKG